MFSVSPPVLIAPPRISVGRRSIGIIRCGPTADDLGADAVGVRVDTKADERPETLLAVDRPTTTNASAESKVSKESSWTNNSSNTSRGDVIGERPVETIIANPSSACRSQGCVGCRWMRGVGVCLFLAKIFLSVDVGDVSIGTKDRIARKTTITTSATLRGVVRCCCVVVLLCCCVVVSDVSSPETSADRTQ